MKAKQNLHGKKTLNMPEKIKLFEWLKSNAHSLDGSYDSDVAKKASEALGFIIAESTVTYMRSDKNIDVSWNPSRSNNTAMNRETWRTLVLAVDHLYKKLDCQDHLSTEFIDLLNKAKSEA